MKAYERLVVAFGRTRVFPWFGRAVLTPLDRALRGRPVAPTTLGTSFPLCHLTTTGRKSGLERTTPLLVIDGPAGWMVAASNFGGPPPAWSLNLREHPYAVLEREGHRHHVTARLASEEEKHAAWVLFDAAWPPFDTYRRRADRPIDVFVLEPTN